MDLKSTYDRIARDWVKEHNTDTWWVEDTDKYASLLPENASVLDVGCGAGVKSKYLLDKGFRVTGIDFSKEMISLSQEAVPNAHFEVKDILQPLSLPDSFDGIFAQAVLLHIPKRDVAMVLENILEPLKPGGYFYVAVKEVKPGRMEEEIVKESAYGYEFGRFFSFFTMDEMQRYLTEAGMDVIHSKITSSGRANWIQVIARKP